MKNSDTGILLNDQNIKLHRQYFKQMVNLVGINVLYREPIEASKEYNEYTELDSRYKPAVIVGCIYDEHPSQKTMRKLGWNAELSDATTIIHVPYDLPGVQVGALFIIPSGLDNAEGRVFRVIRMSNIAVYPASISCELAPVYINTTPVNLVKDFDKSNFNLLSDESDEYGH